MKTQEFNICVEDAFVLNNLNSTVWNKAIAEQRVDLMKAFLPNEGSAEGNIWDRHKKRDGQSQLEVKTKSHFSKEQLEPSITTFWINSWIVQTNQAALRHPIRLVSFMMASLANHNLRPSPNHNNAMTNLGESGKDQLFDLYASSGIDITTTSTYRNLSHRGSVISFTLP